MFELGTHATRACRAFSDAPPRMLFDRSDSATRKYRAAQRCPAHYFVYKSGPVDFLGVSRRHFATRCVILITGPVDFWGCDHGRCPVRQMCHLDYWSRRLFGRVP